MGGYTGTPRLRWPVQPTRHPPDKEAELVDKSSPSCVDLDAACKVLARSPVVRELVKKEVGDEHFPAALDAMRAGKLEGDLGATIHDLLVDAIPNDGTMV